MAAFTFFGEFDLLRSVFGRLIACIVMSMGSFWKPPPLWKPMVVCLGTRVLLKGTMGELCTSGAMWCIDYSSSSIMKPVLVLRSSFVRFWEARLTSSIRSMFGTLN